ncbi:putativeCPS biosynthesis glycosyltransferase [Moritella sp. JT01]|uniref:sugar transferase n=1 Tax=Moritella sp. JT01 TaxID=756698 RepID=UPI000799AACF|nr:sugar transferase [Moritella sp. JT01]KXO13738.1 putativeCPS biosynthesis glycosyltransferase [Moritella sp. JT01]
MIKRLFDFITSFFGILFLSPVLIFIAFWIKKDSNGPILFIQQRVGLNGKSIGVYKFRTMIMDAESKGLKITIGRDPRITDSGHFLRKYKLDELAQLFNVLNGSMSLVGPRPEVQEYIDEYPEDIRSKVLSVRPGITDFASIEFKDENSILDGAKDPQKTYIEEILPIKQQYYLKYVEEQNLVLDIKLILKTIVAIIK